MFILKSDYKPRGDQPYAIKKILDGFLKDKKKELLLVGATGTGKTFTIANVIKGFFNDPNSKKNCVLYLVNNKSLVMQVFKEMQEFFPNDNVGCYISYFGYYRPEAYKPSTGLYFEKKTKSIPEIIRMRQESIHYLSSKEEEKKNVIIVSSVAAIYGCPSPKNFDKEIIKICLEKNILFSIDELKDSMNRLSYTYLEIEGKKIVDNKNIFFKKMKIGNFHLCDEILGFIPEWNKNSYFRIYFNYFSSKKLFISKIEEILIDFEKKTLSFSKILKKINIFPNAQYIKKRDEELEKMILKIEGELLECKKKFAYEGKMLEFNRINKRVTEDILNLRETGTCYGIENYSFYFDDERDEKSPPSTILDFFPKKNMFTIIDESHKMIPQIRAMSNTHFYRMKNLVENGFRLPSAFQNRPLNIDEFFKKLNFILYVSATPGKFEIERTKNSLVEQIIRPTGILDPLIEVRKSKGQIKDIMNSISERVAINQKVLIYALTIAMSEEISKYLEEKGFKVVYIHSKLEVFERHQIINSLRRGVYDVIVGINLLKEGIDLPEVSLVCILDSDKPGFLRDTKSLIQIIGRASRNINGTVFLYANEITNNMLMAMEETNRRRLIQSSYNEINKIIPSSIIKPIRDIISDDVREILLDLNNKEEKDKKKAIKKLRKKMINYSKEFKFDEAISLRDIIYDLENVNK